MVIANGRKKEISIYAIQEGSRLKELRMDVKVIEANT